MYNLHMATRERFCRCGKPLEQSQTVEGKPARWPKYCSDACRQAAYREDSPTTVYRLFDADGGLLYVGCTNGVKARFKTHQATKEWWTEVVAVDLEHYPNRQQALKVEAEAIHVERPKHNKAVPVDVDSSASLGVHLIQIKVPDDLWEQIQDAATADRRSVASWVRLLIEDRLNGGVMVPEGGIYNSSQYPVTAEFQASVAQQAEQPAFNRKRAGSSPARGTGKGSPASTRSEEGRDGSTQMTPRSSESPSRPTKSKFRPGTLSGPGDLPRKPKACKHEDPIRKLGRPYCTDCGEFL